MAAPPPRPPVPGPLGLLAALILLLAGPGCGAGEPPDGPRDGGVENRPPVDVRIALVEAGRAPRVVRAMGTFHARDQVTVSAKAAGRIAEVGAEIGDGVAPEFVLARVDATDQALVRAARSRLLAESLARLGLERLPEGEPDLEALPSIERARLEAANAKSRHDRAARLREKTPDALSEQDVTDLRSAWDVAESALRAARLDARAVLAQARTRKADLDVAEQVERDTVHRAPPGPEVWRVAERRVAVGDYVAVGAPLFRLLDLDPLRLVVRVPEPRVPGIREGQEADVRTAGSPDVVPGRVLRIRPEVDVATRTHEVEVEVPNPGLALSVGAFATAEIGVGEDAAVPMLPASAIRTFAGVSKVFVPDGDKAAERTVSLGRRLGDRVEVVEGLAAGASYVAEPPPGLVAGARIRATR